MQNGAQVMQAALYGVQYFFGHWHPSTVPREKVAHERPQGIYFFAGLPLYFLPARFAQQGAVSAEMAYGNGSAHQACNIFEHLLLRWAAFAGLRAY